MIGVVSASGEAKAVREFFELFKTPWEFYVPHHQYDLVIVTSGNAPADCNANLMAIYNSRQVEIDDRIGTEVQSPRHSEWLDWEGVEFPLYGDVAALRSTASPFLRTRKDSAAVGITWTERSRRIVRLGYDLFK